ncbi:DUF2637 domain-containing protein [Streptomyces netropsis]|uniref:DUF2637 domain-containing protein n=1 Tax=Streptomyces netropsis TaxID=55404 RepID=UPI0037B2B961
MQWTRLLSSTLAALTALIVAAASMLGGVISYPILENLAAPYVPRGLCPWWPPLVYGPWLVAALSILRAAVHQRRAAHSWGVLLLFSGLAVALCVSHAPMSLPSLGVAALPPVTALACFHQMTRQITLTRPPRRARPAHTRNH